MATRHQVREGVASMLYAREIGGESGEFVDEFLGEKKIRNDQREYALSLFEGVNANMDAIDRTLNARLGKWKLDEIGAVERAILRLGTYELLYTDTDTGIVISEAVALANEFGSDSATRLINGVLDAIAKDGSNLKTAEVTLASSEQVTLEGSRSATAHPSQGVASPRREVKDKGEQ